MNKNKNREQKNQEQLPMVNTPLGGVYLANSISRLIKKIRAMFLGASEDNYTKIRIYKVSLNANSVSYLIRRVP